MTVARSVSLVDFLTLLLGNWFWYTTVFRAIIHRGDTPLGHPNYQIGTTYIPVTNSYNKNNLIERSHTEHSY